MKKGGVFLEAVKRLQILWTDQSSKRIDRLKVLGFMAAEIRIMVWWVKYHVAPGKMGQYVARERCFQTALCHDPCIISITSVLIHQFFRL